MLEANGEVQEWKATIAEIERQLNAVVAQRDQLEKQHQQLVYELETQTSQLEQDKEAHAQLNQCLLYPYSAQREELGQLLINTQVTDLKDLLINLDVYLQRMVPMAYRKVQFAEIAKLFNTARSSETIEEQLYGKPVIKLDDNGREYYTYARELNSWDIEILANLALRDYFDSKDLDQLYAQYHEVLAIKEGQYAYFYAINAEVFEQMKQLLVEYLNTHEMWDGDTVAQLKSFHERYQMKLAIFDEGNQQWLVAPGKESGYYQTYAMQDLVQESVKESIESLPETKEEPAEQVSPSRLDTLKARMKRSSSNSIDSAKSLSKPKQDKASDESKTSESSSRDKAKLKAKLRESSSSKSEPSSKTKRSELPSTESASKAKSAKDESKQGITLPSTGEQAIILWGAIALLIMGACILALDAYLRYKKRKALQKIKLD